MMMYWSIFSRENSGFRKPFKSFNCFGVAHPSHHRHRFDLWLGNFRMLWEWPNKTTLGLQIVASKRRQKSVRSDGKTIKENLSAL